MPCTSSILFWIEKLIKLVSTRIRKGGPRSVLCDKNKEEETCALWVRRWCFGYTAPPGVDSHLTLLLCRLFLLGLLRRLLDVFLPAPFS